MSDQVDEQDSSRGLGKPPDSPITLIVMGFLIAVGVGGILIAIGATSGLGVLLFLGWVVAAAGSVMVAVGIVAAGVRLGIRWANYEQSG